MFVEETITKYEEYINPALAKLFRFMGLASVEQSATGSVVTDSNGREFIDCLGGYGVFALGHRHPKVIQAVKDQLDKIPMASKILFNAPMANLAEKLSEITPGDLKYSFFVNSGTEAVEAAMKIARLSSGKKEIISTINSFHGKTLGALSATGREIFRAPFAPLLSGFIHVPFGDIVAIEKAISANTAAIIVEPIQGEGGIIVPPENYLKKLRKLCDENNILLIADEVQTGMGRTGKWFAVDHENVVPDILVLAKALGGGVMPIGAIVARSKVWDKFIESPFLHTTTFGGNQLACVAGLATIEAIVEENLIALAAENGAYLLENLKILQQDYPAVITEVRGKGMMIGMDFSKEGAGGMLMSLLIDAGMLIAYTLNNPKVIRIEPALNMPRATIDIVLAKIRTAVASVNEAIDDL